MLERRIALPLVTLAAMACAADLPPPADRTAWEQLDIVPMPRLVRLTDERIPLANAALVLGQSPSEQDHIGADWINDHIARNGGDRLPTLREGSAGIDAAVRVYIGTRKTCKAIDRAAGNDWFRLGPGVPGHCGYIISTHQEGRARTVYLGGSDPVGALYACVTFAGLLRPDAGAVYVRRAEIADWPDFPTVVEDWSLYQPERGDLSTRIRWGEAPPQETLDAYVEAMKQHLNRLLSWKVSAFKAAEIMRWRTLTPDVLAAYRRVTDYAKARGIRSLSYAFKPFVGTLSDFPDAPKRCATLHNGTRWRDQLRCWSMDDRRRQAAARLGQMLRDSGISDAGFHDTDTGGFLSPAQWEERCDTCRQRWGDDYAAATIRKHRIFYEEIKKAAPDCRLHFTLYPYNITVLTQEGAEQYHIDRYGPSPSIPDVARRVRVRFTDFWKQMADSLPGDVSFCIRENVTPNVRSFHDLVHPHGTFIWYKSGSEQWQTFFDESPCWIPTFLSGNDDLVFPVTLQTFMPVKFLAVREYAWNAKAPGAAGWCRSGEVRERWRHAEPRGEIYTTVLPHVVRALFGQRAAPEITAALSTNVAYNQIFDERYRTTPVLTTHEKMKWQADEATRAAAALDTAFARFLAAEDRLGMDDYAQRRFVYMRELYHCCRWMARARAQNLLAREEAKAGRLEQARLAIEEGRRTIATAREHMEQLVAERPPDPIYNAPPTGNNYKRRWRLYTPVWGVDLSTPEQTLSQTERELPALAAAGELASSAMEQLLGRSLVHVAPTPVAPMIDGRLDEPEWQRAVPVEAFLVYPEQKTLARANTQARFLSDDQTLFAGLTCWMPAGAPVRAEQRERDASLAEDELVELFLSPPHLKGGYIQIMINGAGSIADKQALFSKNPDGAVVRTLKPEWDADGMALQTRQRDGLWQVEIAIPLACLGARDFRGSWGVNVCRDFKGPGQVRELSSVMRPGAKDFHDTRCFLQLLRDRRPAPAPNAELIVTQLETAVRTTDDRVATFADVGLAVNSSRGLHNVRLLAETYDETGRLHLRQTLKQLEHLMFQWESRDIFQAGFERQVTNAGIRIVLESDDGHAERWLRLGDWPGTPTVAPLFTGPDVNVPEADFGRTPALADLCVVPPETPAVAGRTSRILQPRQGTIEFWLRPDWQPPHRADERAPWQSTFTLVHCGILRREHPRLANCSALVLWYDLRRKALHFQIRTSDYAGWDAGGHLPQDTTLGNAEWHHVACVWDADAAQDDWLRLYVDGVRCGNSTRMSKPERLGGVKAVDLGEVAFPLHLLALNTGRNRTPGSIDELRVSGTPRYTTRFRPTREPCRLDRDTTALFHFDGTLEGEGTAPDGSMYALTAKLGPLEYH